MRSVSAIVAGIVATVVAIVTVPVMWLSINVQDEDGYVALSSQLATDAELQGAFAAYLADDFVSRGVLPARLQNLATRAIISAAGATTSRPGFVDAWEETQRSLHASTFGDATGPLVVDVGPMANFVAGLVGDQLPVSLRVETELLVPMGTAQDRERVQLIERSRTLGLLGMMIVLAAAAVCVLAARSRGLALAGLGVGALVVAGVLRLVTTDVAPRLIDEASSASTTFARSIQQLLVDRAADSLTGWLEPIAMAGVAAILLGLAGHVVSGRR